MRIETLHASLPVKYIFLRHKKIINTMTTISSKEFVNQTVGMDDIKKFYPDEWILLGNPEIDEINQAILSGIVLYHSLDKKEVCYLGKPIAAAYDKTALFFNRITPRSKRNVIASLFYPVSQ